VHKTLSFLKAHQMATEARKPRNLERGTGCASPQRRSSRTQRRRVRASAVEKPEPWQEHASSARELFRQAARSALWGSETDPVHASLAIAAEDDALQSKSAVMLPTNSFVRRADLLADDLASKHLSSFPAPASDLASAVQLHLHSVLGFALPNSFECNGPSFLLMLQRITQSFSRCVSVLLFSAQHPCACTSTRS
jgi:hypothetical protein